MNEERLRIQARLQWAWRQLSMSEQARFRPMIEAAHAHLFATDINNNAPPEMALVKTFLEGGAVPELIPVKVDDNGHILGTGKYQVFDIHWVEAVAAYFEYQIIGKIDFPALLPVVIPMPDTTTIMMAGDWGTGNWGPNDSPSVNIAAAITSKAPDYTIHLGDVYYAGNQREEMEHLVNVWPRGKKATFGLNSNHEMYSGGHFYFGEAIAQLFTAQQGQSYFALENNHWIIVGLDSAYFDNTPFCRAGTIGRDVQYQFLQEQVKKDKKIIILTHHNGLADNGAGTQVKNITLWNDIMTVFPGGKGPDFWYWGHMHNGIVYRADDATNHSFCRCLGHGGIPTGFSKVLQRAVDQHSVTWFEGSNANDIDNPLRVMNGFVSLELKGQQLRETFYNEHGEISWSMKH